MSDANWAYTERNRLVVLLAHMALQRGWKAGCYWDLFGDIGWQNVVAIDLPTGQVTWHIGENDLAASGFNTLPKYDGKWDLHTTDEKWDRVYKLVKAFGESIGQPR